MYGKKIGCCLLWSVFLTYHVVSKAPPSTDIDDVLIFTVASNETDGFKMFLRSAEVYGMRNNLHVLGLGEAWKGGNMQYAGGGYKVNLLKQALEKYKDDKERIVIVTDSYDVIFLNELEEIVDRFLASGARVLFSSETTCWPDRSLASKYPPVARGKRYLNSGGFIGYLSDVYSIVSLVELKDEDDDQLFYTKVYLDEEIRTRHKIKLDHKSEIFQCLYGAVADVELRFKGEDAYLQNTAYNTVPLILHGNGHSKIVLNSLSNYLAHAWSPEEGCLACWENTIELDKSKPETFPSISIAVFIEQPTPFLEEFFQAVYRQKYPKSKLHLFIHNAVPYHEKTVQTFVDRFGKEYKSLKQILPSDNVEEVNARNLAMEYCLTKNCSGYFSIDSVSHLDNEHTLKLLVEQQRGIVAPLLVRPLKAWSNFWGATTNDGFYARSFDYMEIIKNERRYIARLRNSQYVLEEFIDNISLPYVV
ncbi:hypothetical protein KM043_012970 [Ampulex compressa]|nr:hypothetical protein KM043_012970 [Ampulex compressa]